MNATFRSLRCVVALPALAALLVLASAGTARANLIGHWTFDDPVGPYDDSSGYGSHGTPSGAPAQDTGLVGSGALRLNGASYLNVGSAGVFDAETYTVSAWLNTDNVTNWRTAVGTWFSPNQWMHFGLDNSRRPSNYVFVDGGQQGIVDMVTPVQPGQWYHMASVVDKASQSLQFWVNGQNTVNIPLATWTTTQTPGAQNVYIGTKDGGGNLWSGLIDDVGIWDQALGADQIEAAYVKGRVGVDLATPLPPQSPASGLVSYWDFEGHTDDVAGLYTNASGLADDHFTPQGGAANYEVGKVGQALRIGVQSGDAPYLTAPYSADVDLPEVYAIEAWIKPTELADSWQRLVLNWGGSERSYHFAIRNNGGFTNAVSLFHEESDGGQPNANGGTVLLDEWQHIAGVADGQFLRVYLDGVEVAATPYDGTIQNITTEGLGLGDSFSALTSIRFNGLIDELAIWNVPLSPQQIASHYLAGAGGYGLTVPEPSSLLLAALGAMALLGYAWRRRTGGH